MIRIGFEPYDNQGPGIFLSRLKSVLEQEGCFDDDNPDVWIHLSFKNLPDWIQARQAERRTRVIVRMDGAYCGRSYKIRKPFTIPVPVLDDWYSAKVNRKKNRLIRENLMLADSIIFQSYFSRRLTQQFVVKTPPGSIIYNGIDLNVFSPEGKCSSSVSPESVNILMSHSFRPYHRLHDGFRILKNLQSRCGRPVHLYILGGDEGKTFKDSCCVARALGLIEGEDFTFLGKLAFQELAPVYRACDFMLNLSYWDTCPNVVIEAMACGLPVLGVNYGGVSELLGTTAGMLVDEAIPFTYLDHQNIEKMPQAPVERYCQLALKLLDQRDYLVKMARKQAEERFDIRQVTQQYQSAAARVLSGSVV